MKIVNQKVELLDSMGSDLSVVLDLNHHTEWIWTGSLMFFSRVCKQRLDSHAQAETREIAQMTNDLIPDKFQYSWKALMHESD